MLGDANTTPLVAMPDFGTAAVTGLTASVLAGFALADIAAVNAATFANNHECVRKWRKL